MSVKRYRNRIVRNRAAAKNLNGGSKEVMNTGATKQLSQGSVLEAINVPGFVISFVLRLRVFNLSTVPVPKKELLVSLPYVNGVRSLEGEPWERSSLLDAEYWYCPEIPPGSFIDSPIFELEAGAKTEVNLVVWNGQSELDLAESVRPELIVVDRIDNAIEIELLKGFTNVDH